MTEKMLEHASALTDMLREDGMWHIRQALKPQTHPDFNGHSCIDCDDEIPPERLALKRIRCTHCQSMKEKQQR